MKNQYSKPQIIIEEYVKKDILLVSIAAEKNGTDNSSFGVDSLLSSIFDDLLGGNTED